MQFFIFVFICLSVFHFLHQFNSDGTFALENDGFDGLLEAIKTESSSFTIKRSKQFGAVIEQNYPWKKRWPIPQKPFPANATVRLEDFKIGYIDDSVIAFLQRNSHIFMSENVTSILYSSRDRGLTNGTDAVDFNFYLTRLTTLAFPLLRASNISQIRIWSANCDLKCLRDLIALPFRHALPPNLRLFEFSFSDQQNLPNIAFPSVDGSANASISKAMCQWVHPPRAADGQPKMFFQPRMRPDPYNDFLQQLMERFLNATTPVCFITVLLPTVEEWKFENMRTRVKMEAKLISELDDADKGNGTTRTFFLRQLQIVRGPAERCAEQRKQWEKEAEEAFKIREGRNLIFRYDKN